MHRRTENVGIAAFGDFKGVVDPVVKYAARAAVAAVAARAAGERFHSYMEKLRVYPLCPQRFLDLAQSRPGAAVLIRASVNQQYLHKSSSFGSFQLYSKL